jgi:hypothetical protein
MCREQATFDTRTLNGETEETRSESSDRDRSIGVKLQAVLYFEGLSRSSSDFSRATLDYVGPRRPYLMTVLITCVLDINDFINLLYGSAKAHCSYERSMIRASRRIAKHEINLNTAHSRTRAVRLIQISPAATLEDRRPAGP